MEAASERWLVKEIEAIHLFEVPVLREFLDGRKTDKFGLEEAEEFRLEEAGKVQDGGRWRS